MDRSSLSNLSSELFEYIAECLDLQDLRHLRCVSREICHKTSQRTFQSYFRTKRVRLTLDELQDFAWATRDGRLGHVVKDLTLVGVVYAAESFSPFAVGVDERSAQRREYLDIFNQRIKEWQSGLKDGLPLSHLQSALDQVRESSLGLDRLSLKVEVVQAPDEPPVMPRESWEDVTAREQILSVAAETGALALAALRQSKVGVRAFDLFTSDPESLFCSLPSDVLGVAFLDGTNDYAPSISGVRSLGICFRDPNVAATAQKLDELQRILTSEIEHRGLAKLLGVCTSVEELRISRFRPKTCSQTSDMWAFRQSIAQQDVHQLAESVKLPSLRTIYLGGLTANIAELMTFIRNHSTTLESIYLHYLEIEQGPLSLLLEQLTLDHYENLKSVGLEHMYEHLEDTHRKIILFDRNQESELTQISGEYARQNIIVRRGADLRTPITYHLCNGRPINSGSAWRGRLRRRELFGDHC